MEIEYFCFSVANILNPFYDINVTDDENTKWVKMQENIFMSEAQAAGKLILFEKATNRFYKDGIEFNVIGKVVLARSFISDELDLVKALEDAKAISTDTVRSIELITNWPLYVQPQNRRVMVTKYKEFIQNHEFYEKEFKRIFIKTAQKSSCHFVIEKIIKMDFEGQTFFWTKPGTYFVDSDATIFLTEAFEDIEDREHETNCREYRAFVIDRKLYSVSRSYVDYPVEIPEDVLLFIQNQIEMTSNCSEFPKNYCLDVGEVMMEGKRVIDIIEYNPLISSGLEASHDMINGLKNNSDEVKLKLTMPPDN